MQCINKNSKEFKDLLKTTTENPVIVAAKASNYLEKHGEFPKHYEDILQDTVKDVKKGVSELFESNPELANSVYEALGFKTAISQDDKSYYRGQIKEPVIDKDGNLILYGKEDKLYKDAGLKSKGVSMTEDLQSSIEYGIGQLEVAENLASENYDAEQELERLSENGYYLIQIPKSISNEIVKEANEVKVIGNKIIIPKGQYKIEQIIDSVETDITPQQKQQAQQLYSQYLNQVFPDSEVKDIVYHFSNVKIDKPNKEKFSLSANINRRKGFFGISKNVNPGNNFANVEGTILHAMLFDMKNPDFGDFSIIPPIVAKDKTKDSAIIKQRGDINYYSVFEPEQIHILGSKKDIEGFKDFVNKKEDSLSFDENSTQYQNNTNKPDAQIARKNSVKIVENIKDINVSEKRIKEIYEDYVNLMDRKREGKSVDWETFNKTVLPNLSVMQVGDTTIFGQWDFQNTLFQGRLMSSKSIKTLYKDLDAIKENFDFMASVPEDIGKMLKKKGFSYTTQGKAYDFKGEKMVKNLYFSSEKAAKRVFNKNLKDVTTEEIRQYDKFFNAYSIVSNIKKALIEGSPASDIVKMLKDLSIYDRNAKNMVRKFNILKERSNIDINSVVQKYVSDTKKHGKNLYEEVIKDIDLTKDENVMYKGFYNLLNSIERARANKFVEIEKMPTDIDQTLNDILIEYLDKLGVKVETVNNLNIAEGMDSLAVTDILNKAILVQKGEEVNLPQEAGYMIAYMMQYNPAISEISSIMSKKGLFAKSATKDQKLRAIGDLIAKELLNKTDQTLPEKLKQQLRILVRQFLDFINSGDMSRMNKKLAYIADNILTQNQALITASKFKPGEFGKPTKQVTLKEALEKDKFGSVIVKKLSKEGFILTGSTSLGEQGTIQRPDENPLHDIDWVSPFKRKETKEKFLKVYPDAIFVRDIQNESAGYMTDSYLIAPENHTIKNYSSTLKENKKGEKVIVISSYDVVDSADKVVGKYRDESKEKETGVKGKVIDFFSYEKFEQEEPIIKDGVKLAHWREIFSAKLEFARYKDIWDYNRFNPFKRDENIENDQLDMSLDFSKPDAPSPGRLNEIQYTLKAVDILQSNKAKQVFSKGEKNNWDLKKILTELQIPKQQKQLILNSDSTNREDILLDLASNYSFAVEVNTAKERESTYEELVENRFRIKEEKLSNSESTGNWLIIDIGVTGDDYKIVGKETSPAKAQNFIENNLIGEEKPTQYYSNLTVPGGTNYTENAIRIPGVVNIISKDGGHHDNEFNQSRGDMAGWFRSDEKILEDTTELEKEFQEALKDGRIAQDNYDDALKNKYKGFTTTKTRRILELQSNLFQKGREKKDLVQNENVTNSSFERFTWEGNLYETDNGEYFTKNGKDIEYEEYTKAAENYYKNKPQNKNQFLQLLNKKNNWVTFFVKSVVQDSAKKGYEKVLFPKGDTAAKIEGHQTLEEFKKQKEDRIKELESTVDPNRHKYNVSPITNDIDFGDNDKSFKTIEEAKKYIEENGGQSKFSLDDIIDLNEEEIRQLKQELADVESGQTQLSSIAKFYENTIANILKKQGYKPKEITDEYGNKWNEVVPTEEPIDMSLDFSKPDAPSPGRLVEDRAYELARELPPEDKAERLREVFDTIEEDVFTKWASYNPKFNKEKTQATITITPSLQRQKIKSMDSAKRVAEKMRDAINSQFLHKDFHKDSSVASVSRNKGSYEVLIKPSQRMLTFVNQFAVNHSTTTFRTQKKYYKRKAIEQLRLEDVFSPEMYTKMIKENRLNNISLNMEEMRLDMEKTESQKRDSQEGKQLSFFPEPTEDSLFSEDSSTVDETSVLNLDYYTKRREEQIELANNRIKSLKNKIKLATREQSKVFSRKIVQLKDVVDRLQEDIKNVNEIKKNPEKKLRESFEKDIESIKELQKDPNYDNIFMAKALIKFIEDFKKVRGNETSPHLEGRPRYKAVLNYKEVKDQSPEIEELKSYLGKELSNLEDKQEENTTKIFLEILEKYQSSLQKFYGKDKTLEELKDELIRSLDKDTDMFSAWVGSLGSDLFTEDLVGQLMRVEYEIQEAKNYNKVNVTKAKINGLMEDAAKELKKLGHDLHGKTNWLEPFTKKLSNGDLVIISKYNEKWKDFLAENFFGIKDQIFKAIGNREYAKMDQLRGKKYDVLNANADFIDFTKLPEIAEVYGNNGLFKVDRLYTAKLKKRLGKKEYNDMINRQLSMLAEYEIRKKQMTKSFLQGEGVVSIKDLPGREKEILKSRQNIMSPYFFVKNMDKGNKVPYVAEGGTVYSKNHSLDFNSFVPKENKTEFLEEKYKKIENNPILSSFMEVLDEAVTTINGNIVTSNAFAQSKRSLMFSGRTLRESFLEKGYLNRRFLRVGRFFPDSIKWFKDIMSSDTRKRKIKKRPELKTKAKSFKRVVDSEFQADKETFLYAMGETGKKGENKTFYFDSMSPEEKSMLYKSFVIHNEADFKREFPEGKFKVYELKGFTQRRVYENQTLDLPKLLKMLLDQSAIFKAQEEALDQYTQILKPSTDSQLKGDNEKIEKTKLAGKRESFEKQVLRGDRNTANWGKISGKIGNMRYINLPGGFFKENMIGFKNYSRRDKRLVKVYTKRLKDIKKLKKGLDPDDPTLESLKEEELTINQNLDALGVDYTIGAFYEQLFLNLGIKTSLGWSPSTYVKNLVQASQQNSLKAGFRDKDGNLVGDYDDEQLRNSDAFVLSLASPGNLGAKEVEGKKMYSFIDALGVVQDGTDIAQRAERVSVQAPTLNPLKKRAWNMMAGMNFTEYYNQVPAILSVAQNYNMPDGNPIFNGKEFPYHELVDGVLKLKEEYLTAFDGFTPEQMKERYETFSDDKALMWKTNIKTNIIPKRNGDYTISGVSSSKSDPISRVITMFSNWVYKILESAFGGRRRNLLTGEEEWGYMHRLVKQGKGRHLGTPLLLQGSAISLGMLGASAISFSSLFTIAPLVGILWGGVAAYKIKDMMSKKEIDDTEIEDEANQVINNLSTGDVSSLFINNTVTQPLNMFLSAAGTIMKATTGFGYTKTPTAKEREQQNWLKKVMNVNYDYTMEGKIDSETAISLKQLAKQMAITQSIAMLSYITLQLFGLMGGDEEEDELKGPLQEAQYKRRQEEKIMMSTKRYVMNLISSAYSDASITLDPQALIYTVLKEENKSEAFAPVPMSVGKAITYWITGSEVERPGHMWQGKSKGWMHFYRAFAPKPLRNYPTEDWAGGFEIGSQRYYNKNWIYEMYGQTDYKRARTEAEDERSKIRHRLKSGDNWEEVLDNVSKYYDSKDLNRAGALHLLSKYKGKRLEDMSYQDKERIEEGIETKIDMEVEKVKRNDFNTAQERTGYGTPYD